MRIIESHLVVVVVGIGLVRVERVHEIESWARGNQQVTPLQANGEAAREVAGVVGRPSRCVIRRSRRCSGRSKEAATD